MATRRFNDPIEPMTQWGVAGRCLGRLMETNTIGMVTAAALAALARAARLQNTDEHVIGEKRYIKGVVVS